MQSLWQNWCHCKAHIAIVLPLYQRWLRRRLSSTGEGAVCLATFLFILLRSRHFTQLPSSMENVVLGLEEEWSHWWRHSWRSHHAWHHSWHHSWHHAWHSWRSWHAHCGGEAHGCGWW